MRDYKMKWKTSLGTSIRCYDMFNVDDDESYTVIIILKFRLLEKWRAQVRPSSSNLPTRLRTNILKISLHRMQASSFN